MSSDSPATTAAVAAVIDAHTATGYEGNVTCWCGPNFDSWAEHSEHVAAAVLEALGAAGFSVVASVGRAEKHYQQWRRGRITNEGTTHG